MVPWLQEHELESWSSGTAQAHDFTRPVAPRCVCATNGEKYPSVKLNKLTQNSLVKC